MPRRKDDYTAGLETILNNHKTSFLKEPKVFHEIHKGSEMSLSQMIRHIGRGSKAQTKKEPTDKEKSEARIKELEAKAEENKTE
jgi:hypothetical protein